MIPGGVSERLDYQGSVPIWTLRILFLSDDVVLRADDGVRGLGVRNRITLEEKRYLHGGSLLEVCFCYCTIYTVINVNNS